MGYLNNAGLQRFWNGIKSKFVRTVNGVAPDANGNVQVSGGSGTALGNRGVFYGTCSTAAATVGKEVVCPDFTANDLVAGSVVMVLFSVTNNGAVGSLTLNVNETGAKSIKHMRNGSLTSIPSAGYLKADQIYQFTYDGTYWVVEMNYDINNNAYQSYMADAKIKTYTNLYRYMLCFTKDDQTILPVNAVSNTVATGKQLTTEEFNPFGPIYYYNSTTTVNAGSKTGSLYYFAADVDFRYSFNTAKTLTASKNVYLVCVPQSTGNVKLASNPISQNLPTTEDDKIYILLGVAYDSYRVCLHPVHPVYYFKNGQIRIWTNPRESKVHFVHATDYNWALDGLSAQAYSDTSREQILSWLANDETVILSITDPNSYQYWLYAMTDDSQDVFFESSLEYYASTGYCCYHAIISDGPDESQCSIVKRIIRCVPSGGSTNQVLTKDTNGYSWQGIPKQVHLVGMDSITWDAGFTSATGEVSETRAQILSWLQSGDLVFLNVGNSGEPIWMFPQSDDAGEIYFGSVTVYGEYYEATFHDGSTTRISVARATISQVPSSGSSGQVLTKTAYGYAWNDVPKQVHLVGMDSITWSGSTATGEVSETRAQILSWLNSGDLVFLNVGNSSYPIWLFPYSDDTGVIYFCSGTSNGGYYEAYFADGNTSTQISVDLITISPVPSGGTTGQVLTKTAYGYAWQSLPTYNGGVS